MFLWDPPPVDEVQRRTVPFLQTSYPYRCRSTENNVHRMICASRHPPRRNRTPSFLSDSLSFSSAYTS